MAFTYRLVLNDKLLPSSQMPSRNPMWYRVWLADVTGRLPPSEGLEWLAEWMATAQPGDRVYLTEDHSRSRPFQAHTFIDCDPV